MSENEMTHSEKPVSKSPNRLLAQLPNIAAATIAVTLLDLVDIGAGGTMLIPPLAASAMLAFLAPDLPFSQPRALVGGNMLAAISGVVAFHAAGTGPLGVAIAVGLAIGLMVMARAAHAPAAATAVLATKVSAGLLFPVLPVAGACAAIVLAATAFHRVTGKSSYPMRWL